MNAALPTALLFVVSLAILKEQDEDVTDRLAKVLSDMRRSPANVRFIDLLLVCRHYFGEPRSQGSSHHVFKMPWPGDPRVNIQDRGGRAKPYQVKQVLMAIKKLEERP
jgi:hypothetical protein